MKWPGSNGVKSLGHRWWTLGGVDHTSDEKGGYRRFLMMCAAAPCGMRCPRKPRGGLSDLVGRKSRGRLSHVVRRAGDAPSSEFFARCLRFDLPHQSMRRLVMVARRPRRPCGSARCADENPWLAATGTDRSSSVSARGARLVLKAYRVEIAAVFLESESSDRTGDEIGT